MASKKIQTIPLYLRDTTPNTSYASMPITEAQLNHLHRLIGWVRCEFNLSPACLQGAADAYAFLIDEAVGKEEKEAITQHANARLSAYIAKIEEVPLAVRNAIEILSNAISDNPVKKENSNEIVALRTFIQWLDEWLKQQQTDTQDNAVALQSETRPQIAKYVFNGVKQMKKAIEYYNDNFAIC